MNVSLPRISNSIISSVTGNANPVTERRALNPIPVALGNQRQEGISPYQMPGQATAPRNLRSPIFTEIADKANNPKQGIFDRIFGGNNLSSQA